MIKPISGAGAEENSIIRNRVNFLLVMIGLKDTGSDCYTATIFTITEFIK